MHETVELALAGSCFAAGLVCCAGSWRRMLAARIDLAGAVARYGAGSLTNTLLPGRAGDAVRLGLFGRIAPGGAIAAAGGAAAIGAMRWFALMPLGIAGMVRSTLPPLALAVAGVALLPLPLVWIFARRGSHCALAALAPLRCASRATYAAVAGWICGTLIARIGGVTLAGSALGVSHPLIAALLVVPALELAAIVPLTPGNVGVAGGAAAVAFHAQGVPMHAALAAGLGVHAVETVAGVVVGGTSVAALLRSGVRILPLLRSPLRHRSAPDPVPM